MKLEDKFEFEGFDELDTQLKLYEMGIESFSPYAGSGKVDMIIRSENGIHVRYADIKVSIGKREKNNVIWRFNVSFFMESESFLISTVRIPNEEGISEKHYLIFKSKDFLKIAQKHKLKVIEDSWVISLPFSDIQQMTKQSNATYSTLLGKTIKKYFDNWDCLLQWKTKS